MRRVLSISSFVLVLSRCNPENMEAPLMETSEISLTWKGNTYVLYNAST
jgi:hypothetical protein